MVESLEARTLLSASVMESYGLSKTGTAVFAAAAQSATTVHPTPVASWTNKAPLIISAWVGSTIPGSPTGTVRVLEGVNTVGTAQLTDGSADIAVSGLSVGSHTLSVVYDGDANFAPSQSSSWSTTITSSATTTTLSSSLAKATWGQAATFTAAVKTSGPTPTGTVRFVEGRATLGTVSVNSSGVAQLTLASLSAGTHYIRAYYSGDDQLAGSNSAYSTLEVLRNTTRTYLDAAWDSTSQGQDLVLLADVYAAKPATARPTGTVVFWDGSTVLGTANLVNGRARLDTYALTPGVHSIYTTYVGNSSVYGSLSQSKKAMGVTTVDLMVAYTPDARDWAGSVSKLVQTINDAVRQTNEAFINSLIGVGIRLVYTRLTNYVESGMLDDKDGKKGDLTALYSPDDGHMDELQGLRNKYGADLVSLFESDGDLGGLSYELYDKYDPTNADYGLSVVLAPQATGPIWTLAHELGHNFGATHDTANASSDGAAPYSHGYRFWANGTQYHDIMSYDPGTTIQYFSNPNLTYKGVPIGNTTVSNSARVINAMASTVAAYRKPTVATPATSVTTVSTSTSTITYGGKAAFMATVKPVKGKTLPTGSVMFLDGNTLIGTATIRSGKAGLATTALPVGTRSIKAVYMGDRVFAPSASGALRQAVSKPRASAAIAAAEKKTPTVQATSVWPFTFGLVGIAIQPKRPTSDVLPSLFDVA